MAVYYDRILDKYLKKKLNSIGAVLIQGPKWCGKTTTGKHLANSIIKMDDLQKSNQYKEMAQINPGLLLKGETPLLIDEWQLAPTLWNAVRSEVDDRGEFGQFILTGSSVPAELDENYHTGTGRITKVLMRPMSLFESKDSSGEVSLMDLFDGLNVTSIDNHTLDDIAFLICRGGWPLSVNKDRDVALEQAINYYDAIVNDDISRVDGVRRDILKTRKLLRSYARNVATQSSLESIKKDVSNEVTFTYPTLLNYIEALRKIFVIEDSPSWNPNLRSKTAIRSSETRYFIDPSIATAALGVGPNDLINDLNTMGLLFENLVIRDLRIYIESHGGNLYHYRDKNDLECDAVVHLRDGRYGLIEIKLGGDHLIEDGIKTLNKLESIIDTNKMNKPSFKMVICGVCPFAYKNNDGIYIVPIGCLKD